MFILFDAYIILDLASGSPIELMLMSFNTHLSIV